MKNIVIDGGWVGRYHWTGQEWDMESRDIKYITIIK